MPLPLLAPAIGLWRWLAGTRIGRAVALVGGIALALILARRSGRQAAEQARERADMRAALDIHQRGAAALHAAEQDTRPADAQLTEHGRLRDD